MQKEHSGDSTFLSLKSILFTNRIFLSILYWKTLNFVSTVTLRGKRYIDFSRNQNCWRVFYSQKEYCLVFCTEKVLILYQQLPDVVKDILPSSRNRNCWNTLYSTTAKLVFCTFQKFLFDIILYFPTCSISCFFRFFCKFYFIRWWSKMQRFVDFPLQFKIWSFHNLGKASVNWIQRYFNLFSRLYSDLT